MTRKKRSKVMVIGAVIFLGCVAALIITANYVDKQLAVKSWEDVYDDCYKIWATRGLVLAGPQITPDGMQNSIESIQLAFERGARGTEVDVLFDTGMGQFIVSHDLPYNLKHGKLLTLEALFEKTGGQNYFWIDFKKIRKLSDRELEASVAEMERLAKKFDIKKWIYVEGEAPFSLAAYRDAGFNTIYDIHPRSDRNLFTPAIIALYKMVFYFGDFTVMAMNYGPMDDPKYGPRTQELLGDIPLFIYHIEDDRAALERLLGSRGVRVILVRDHSLDRYQLSACPK
jgi:hypothetical protein